MVAVLSGSGSLGPEGQRLSSEGSEDQGNPRLKYSEKEGRKVGTELGTDCSSRL